MITENKHTQRLKSLFQSTPVLNTNKFFAAHILTHSTKYSNITKKNKTLKTVIIIAFVSFVLGVILIVMGYSIKNRKI